MSADESASHFAGWAIVSAPLVLGFDLTNQTRMDLAWPVEISLATENLLENTGGVLRPPSVFSRGGSLLPSSHADLRASDDVIAI